MPCGNGTLDPGEACDTAITAGVGSCPTTCNDGQVCTTDTLENGGTCQALCAFPDITQPANGDGCCPPGADGNSDDDCNAVCGNGTVESPAESCDTGIATGQGSCPTTCSDGVACTADNLVNGGSCQAVCVFPAITTAVNGDGCCPMGANANNDDDCMPVCGNGTVESPESCDTAIISGMGACPAACDDMQVCTTNVLQNGGTCMAQCQYPAITMPANNDGCCPPGANGTNDNDCNAVCGNGVVEGPAEICDTGIASGMGSCPSTCSDGVACTTDTLMNGNTCQAQCVFPPITAPANGDGCCPMGANANNDNDCMAACGNGVREPPAETCDTAIASGMDACPAMCSDGVACTSDILQNAGTCQAACTYPPITMPINNDGCCPPGANANNDNNCMPVCGNTVVESGEVCDTAITSGAGRCPSTCNDSMACTSDVLVNAGTCQAACTFPPITMPINNDGCCPPGANATNDTDCAAVCGNGTVETPAETCDTGIASGNAGSCPASCSDGIACTTDTLVNGGTCQAACTFPPITMPINNDGCCPPGANANNDNNCMPVCGNTVTEPPTEECDDGNMDPFDGCDGCMLTAPSPTAFRINTLSLMDPHAFVLAFGFFCTDATATLNTQLQNYVQQDANPADGVLDLSLVEVFRPLDQANNASTPADFYAAPRCTAPLASTSCNLNGSAGASATATSITSGASTCLAPVSGSVRPYNPAVATPTGPCFSTTAADMTLNVGFPVPLRSARVGARYTGGTPATGLSTGIIMGFITEADANAIIMPPTFPAPVGGAALSSILRGGNGNCSAGSDVDTFMGSPGWWLYFNFTATAVPWTEP